MLTDLDSAGFRQGGNLLFHIRYTDRKLGKGTLRGKARQFNAAYPAAWPSCEKKTWAYFDSSMQPLPTFRSEDRSSGHAGFVAGNTSIIVILRIPLSANIKEIVVAIVDYIQSRVLRIQIRFLI